ncbi:MAG: type II secretion system protein, partial [Verrucomicrobiota bacterium]
MKRPQPFGYTMIEVIVSLTILSGMALMLSGILGTASNNWVRGEEMVEASQSGRTSLELIAREMASPIVGPRQQFQIMNGATLRGSVNAEIPQVPSSSMAAFWLAPLGTDGQLRRVGYYLERRDERGFYRLKRL